MRIVFLALLFGAVLLSGCVSVPGLRAAAHSDRVAAIQSECQSNGSNPGTNRYARCITQRDQAENARIENERDAATAAGIEAGRVYSTESGDPALQPTDMDCNFTKDGKYTCVGR